MKSLPAILSVTFLSLTLTNCSLSREEMASRVKPSILKIFYRNQPGHENDFLVARKTEIYTQLREAYGLKKDGKRLLGTEKGKVGDVTGVRVFSGDVDSALVAFEPERGKSDDPTLKIGSLDSLKISNYIFISGFLRRGGKVVSQFMEGTVSPDFGYLKESLSNLEWQTFRQAEERLETGFQGWTFSRYIPINFLWQSKFYSVCISGFNSWVLFLAGVILGGGIVYFGLRYFQLPGVAKQRQRELERQLKDEQLTRQQIEETLNSVQNTDIQTQREWEWPLECERDKTEEVETLAQRPSEFNKSQYIEYYSYVDVPLVSAVGVDYTRLCDLLVTKQWKEADLETWKVMLKVAGRELKGCLRVKDVENFPSLDLSTIDKLWVKYSSGKFGFSVQKQIYQNLVDIQESESEAWKAFGDKVGWRRGGEWLSYDRMTFSDQHYMGHLPGIWVELRED